MRGTGRSRRRHHAGSRGQQDQKVSRGASTTESGRPRGSKGSSGVGGIGVGRLRSSSNMSGWVHVLCLSLASCAVHMAGEGALQTGIGTAPAQQQPLRVPHVAQHACTTRRGRAHGLAAARRGESAF